MPKLECLFLRSVDPAAKAGFYRDILGMTQIGPARFSYGSAEMAIEFEQAISGPYQPGRSDLYWKVAISVPDLDLAVRQLS